MAINNPKKLSDGFSELSGGVDSGRNPIIRSELHPIGLMRNQVAWAVNTTFRTGRPGPRPGYKKINATFVEDVMNGEGGGGGGNGNGNGEEPLFYCPNLFTFHPPAFVSGKIGEAGLFIDPITPEDAGIRDIYFRTDIPVGQLGTRSFTVRFWFRHDREEEQVWITHHTMMVDTLPNKHGGKFFLHNRRTYSELSTPGSHLRWRVGDLSTIDLGVTAAEKLNDGDWHRIVVWYDHGTLEYGIQLDNDTAVTDTLPSALPEGDASGFLIGYVRQHFSYGLGSDVFYDEVAIWDGHVLTPTERLNDWNSGNGVGFSAAQAISGLASYWSFDSSTEFISADVPPLNFNPDNWPYGVRDLAEVNCIEAPEEPEPPPPAPALQAGDHNLYSQIAPENFVNGHRFDQEDGFEQALQFQTANHIVRTDGGISKLGRRSFTIRTWIKIGAASQSQDLVLLSSVDNDFGIGAVFQLSVASPDSPSPDIVWRVGGTSVHLGAGSDGAALLYNGQWGRLYLWYDASTLEVGAEINDWGAVTATLPEALPDGDGVGIIFGDGLSSEGGAASDINFDETAVFDGYVPTEDERINDWNTGDGWGFDLTQNISGLAAYWRFDSADEFDTSVVDPPTILNPDDWPTGIVDMTSTLLHNQPVVEGDFRYIRILISDIGGSSSMLGILEFELYEESGGPNVAVDGTPSASGFNTGNEPEKAFDGLLTNGNGWAFSHSFTFPQWLQYDFGVGVTRRIKQYRVGSHAFSSSVFSRSVKDWKLQGSNNGTDWTDLHEVENQTFWWFGQMRTFGQL